MKFKNHLIGVALGLSFFLSIPWLVIGFYNLDWVFNLVGRQ